MIKKYEPHFIPEKYIAVLPFLAGELVASDEEDFKDQISIGRKIVMAIEFDDANFKQKVIESQKLVLVDFFTPTCGPCRKLAPIIDKLSDELQDKAIIGKINVAENPEAAVAYKISAVPTLILFKNGEEVKRMLGIVSEADLKNLIEMQK